MLALFILTNYSGASWVYQLDKLSNDQVEWGDKNHHHRLGNIAAIDDMVLAIIQRLKGHGILDNTYIIYTSDNGKKYIVYMKTLIDIAVTRLPYRKSSFATGQALSV